MQGAGSPGATMRRLLSAVTLSLPIILACGPEDRGNRDSVTDALSLWGRFAELACTKARNCCEQAQLSSEGLANCEQELPQQTGAADLIRFVGDESIAMDRVLFASCLDEAEKLLDECGKPAPIEACANAIRGLLGAGKACTSPIQCARTEEAALCLSVVAGDEEAAGSAPGVCRDPLRGKRGDACVHTCVETPCLVHLTTRAQPKGRAFCFSEDGLYCNRDVQRCERLHQPGDTCEDSESCGGDAFCNDEHVCQEAAELGDECEYGDECKADLMCSDTAGTCEEWSPVSEDFCAGDWADEPDEADELTDGRAPATSRSPSPGAAFANWRVRTYPVAPWSAHPRP
jgi:hypothetical protein